MAIKVDIEKIYAPSQEVVARDIQGEFIIIPISSGIGDMEDALFTLSETAKIIWDRLDGKKKLKEIVNNLSLEFESPAVEIKNDVLGFAGELLKRRILIEIK